MPCFVPIRTARRKLTGTLVLFSLSVALLAIGQVTSEDDRSAWNGPETELPVISAAFPAAPQSSTEKPGQGKFLVASRDLNDPNFSQKVVLLVDHGQEGAMGLIINQPTNVALSELLPEIESLSQPENKVFLGGPVQRSGILLLIRAESEPVDSQQVFADVYVSSSRETLTQLAEGGASKKRFRAYAGYSGWGPGQLEFEMSKGSWHVLPAKAETIFDTSPGAVWRKLIRQTVIHLAGLPRRDHPLLPHLLELR